MTEVAGRSSKAVTMRTLVVGRMELRLAQKGDRFYGLIDGKIEVEGDEPDEVWRLLLDGRGPSAPRYVGFDGAKKLFLHYYPNGFHTDSFSERGYKARASSKLRQAVPVEDAAVGTGFGESVLSAFRDTDLLHPIEKSRAQDVLRGSNSDPFIQAAARFTLDDNPRQALRDMDRALHKHEAAKWTIVTYLPFFWRPDRHMFLKPEATKDFAERTGQAFKEIYDPALDFSVYVSLLNLAAKTGAEIADLNPRDNIDIQSFIWVVSGAYDGENPRP